ncbi:MAG: ECF-type sigma factor [Phycisphaerales bacterium]
MGHDQSNLDLTLALDAAHGGDPAAASRVLSLVYGELRAMAEAQLRQSPGHGVGNTLQPTALVHEAYLKLFGNGAVDWQGRAHFFGAAGRAMRQILVDQARRKGAAKRGGGGGQRREGDVELLPDQTPAPGATFEITIQPGLVQMDEALERLHAEDPRKAEIVHLRYFAGLTSAQVAQVLNLSERTVEREWRFTKAWLKDQISRASTDIAQDAES